jgi:hypothetical protein
MSAAFEKMLGRTNLNFDRQTGAFEMNHRLLKTIVVQSKLDIRWLRHALERLHYKILQNPASLPKDIPVLTYETNKGIVRFQYTFNKQQEQFPTIYELCNFLRNSTD